MLCLAILALAGVFAAAILLTSGDDEEPYDRVERWWTQRGDAMAPSLSKWSALVNVGLLREAGRAPDFMAKYPVKGPVVIVEAEPANDGWRLRLFSAEGFFDRSLLAARPEDAQHLIILGPPSQYRPPFGGPRSVVLPTLVYHLPDRSLVFSDLLPTGLNVRPDGAIIVEDHNSQFPDPLTVPTVMALRSAFSLLLADDMEEAMSDAR